jgi:HK97 family phage portal protein
MGLGALLQRARPLPTGSVPLSGPVDSGPIVGMPGGDDVTTEQALGLPAVAAAVGLLSSATAALPLRVLDERAGEVFPQVLTSPNPSLSTTELVRQAVVSMLGWGDAFLLITGRDLLGFPTDLVVAAPQLVGVTLDPISNLPEYRIGGQVWPRGDVLHIPYNAAPGAIRGTSPLRQCRQAIGLALGAMRFAAGYYGSGAVPTAVIKSTVPDLSQDEAQAIKSGWMRAQRTRTPMVLSSTLDLQIPEVSEEGAAFIEAQRFAVAEVARVFGLAPEDIGGSSGSAMTYSNETARRDAFQRQALMPIVVAVEEGLTRLVRPGQRVDIDMDAGLRPLTAQRYDTYATAIEAGFMAPETAAEIEGLPVPPPRPANPQPPAQGAPGAPEPDPDDRDEVRAVADLRRYWTAGAGRVKWSRAAKPLAELYRHLLPHMPPDEARAAALSWFADAMGRAPKPRDGIIPTGEPDRKDTP